MKSKGFESPDTSADNWTKLSTDRPAAVEEVTRVFNMTSWRSNLRWDESYKPLSISHRICRKTRTELFTLRMEKCKQTYQKKLQNTEHQPQKVQGQQAWVYLSYCVVFAPFLCHRLAKRSYFWQVSKASLGVIHQALSDALKRDQANMSQRT